MALWIFRRLRRSGAADEERSQRFDLLIDQFNVLHTRHIDIDAVKDMIPRIKAHVRLPVGVGFGIRDGATARAVADAWDPAKDTAAGNACKSYGAAGIMRVPGRLHITWQDDQTLKLEMDSGTQTRTFSLLS